MSQRCNSNRPAERSTVLDLAKLNRFADKNLFNKHNFALPGIFLLPQNQLISFTREKNYMLHMCICYQLSSHATGDFRIVVSGCQLTANDLRLKQPMIDFRMLHSKWMQSDFIYFQMLVCNLPTLKHSSDAEHVSHIA